MHSKSDSKRINNHCLPIADTGDCTEGVTVTVIGVLDNPLLILTITSITPDDSEPTNRTDAKSTTNTTLVKYSYTQNFVTTYIIIYSLVESMMTPVAVYILLSAVIAGPSDDGTLNVK